jgi:hypothetical protein
MKYLIVAMVCMGCSPVINTPVAAPTAIVTVRQLPGVLIVGESSPMAEESNETYHVDVSAGTPDSLTTAIEAAVKCDRECLPGDPLCECL